MFSRVLIDLASTASFKLAECIQQKLFSLDLYSMGATQAGRVNIANVTEPLLDASAPSQRARSHRRISTPRDILSGIIVGVLHRLVPCRMDDLQMPRVAALVRQLRQRVTLVLLCTILTTPIAVYLLCRGMATYISSAEHPECSGPLRTWLVGFLILQLLWPIRMLYLSIIILGWCLIAAIFLHQTQCQQLNKFLVHAALLQIVQAILLLVSNIAAVTARPLIEELNEILHYDGTAPEVLERIMIVPTPSISVEEECVICISREDEDEMQWRQLFCGHRFHEPCLLKWLRKARRCPVCRLDLHDAYRQHLSSSFDIRVAEAGNPNSSMQPGSTVVLI